MTTMLLTRRRGTRYLKRCGTMRADRLRRRSMIRGSMNIAASQPKLSGPAIRACSPNTSAGSLRVWRCSTRRKRMRSGEGA